MTNASTRPHGLRQGELPGLRLRHPLGTSGLEVSPFCLGLTIDPRTVCEAFDAGINFFFVTADMHWPVYEATRKGLEMLLARGGGVRDQIVVAGVSYVTQPEFCFAPFEELIGAVKGLERLELTILGGSYASDLAGRLVQYRTHKLGVVPGVRATGATFHDRAAALLALDGALVDVGFVRFNAAHPGAKKEIFPALERARPLVYNFKTMNGHVPPVACEKLIEEGSWIPRPVDHYRYVMSHAEVDGILCGLTEPAHVKELADAMVEGALAADECAYVEELAKRAVRAGIL